MDGSPRRRSECSLETPGILPDGLTMVSELQTKTTFTATEQGSEQKDENYRIRPPLGSARITTTGLASSTYSLLSVSTSLPTDLDSLTDEEVHALSEEETQGLALPRTIPKSCSQTLSTFLPQENRSIPINLDEHEIFKDTDSDGVLGGNCYVAPRSSYAIRYLNLKNDERQAEKELEVLDRLMKYQCPTRDSDSSFSVGGDLFVKRIHYIFYSDEKIYVIHSYSERTLCDPYTASWFRLPASFESSAMSPALQMDPDGTFHQRADRTQLEVIGSLQLLAAELTLGLNFLHDCGIVHQDIKPVNIVITPLGHVQISDFGAASLLPTLLPGPNLSGMRSPTRPSEHPQEFGSLVIGPDDMLTFTPRYAAPELMKHNEDGLIIYDEKIDWWSLGLTLSELAYGDIDMDPDSQPKTGTPPKLNQFLSQLLVVDPQDRLSGFLVREHEFFDFGPEVWEKIMDLRYPPCPSENLKPRVVPNEPEDGTTDFSLVVEQLVSSKPQAEPEDALSKTDDQSSDTQPFPSTASLYEFWNGRRISMTGGDCPFQENVALSQVNSSKSGSLQSSSQGTDIVFRCPTLGSNEANSPCQSEIMAGFLERGYDEDWEDVTMDDMILLSLLQTELQTKDMKSHSRQAKKIAKKSKRTILVMSRNIYATLRCGYN